MEVICCCWALLSCWFVSYACLDKIHGCWFVSYACLDRWRYMLLLMITCYLLGAHACSFIYLDGDMLLQFCWFYYVISMHICFLLLTVYCCILIHVACFLFYRCRSLLRPSQARPSPLRWSLPTPLTTSRLRFRTRRASPRLAAAHLCR